MKISIVQENPVVGDVKGNLALALNAIEDLKKEKPDLVLFSEMFLTGYPPEDLLLRDDLFVSLVTPKVTTIKAYIIDARYSLITVVLAGLAKGISEVGAVIIVGGNIDHLTRVMTTTITMETSKGELSLALALGIILLITSITINLIVTYK